MSLLVAPTLGRAVYFAVRPDKWWITKGMIFGYISRRHYLEHHDPQRWNVRGSKGSPGE